MHNENLIQESHIWQTARKQLFGFLGFWNVIDGECLQTNLACIKFIQPIIVVCCGRQISIEKHNTPKSGNTGSVRTNVTSRCVHVTTFAMKKQYALNIQSVSVDLNFLYAKRTHCIILSSMLCSDVTLFQHYLINDTNCGNGYRK